jgi:hypothetical protein
MFGDRARRAVPDRVVEARAHDLDRRERRAHPRGHLVDAARLLARRDIGGGTEGELAFDAAHREVGGGQFGRGREHDGRQERP